MKLWITLVLVWLIGSSCSSPQRMRGKLQDEPFQLLGSWFGFAQGDVYLYWLEVAGPGGRGAVASKVTQSNLGFKIESWSSKKGLVAMELSGGEKELNLSRIDAHFVTRTMLYGHVCGRGGWSNEVMFYKEEPFSERIRMLKRKAFDEKKKEKESNRLARAEE